MKTANIVIIEDAQVVIEQQYTQRQVIEESVKVHDFSARASRGQYSDYVQIILNVRNLMEGWQPMDFENVDLTPDLCRETDVESTREDCDGFFSKRIFRSNFEESQENICQKCLRVPNVLFWSLRCSIGITILIAVSPVAVAFAIITFSVFLTGSILLQLFSDNHN